LQFLLILRQNYRQRASISLRNEDGRMIRAGGGRAAGAHNRRLAQEHQKRMQINSSGDLNF
jgi:hypothetical protein